MTRVIAGRAKGRRLATPRGDATRPTSDRVREALFSAVESWCGSLHGLRVLDLYAGSGAVGLEAWSRGAEAVTLVEQDRRTAALVSDNARTIGFAQADVRASSVAATLRQAPAEPFDVVFLDPPYPLADDAVAADLAALVEHGWLAAGALVVVERAKRSTEPDWPDGLVGDRSKRYGETVLWYGHAAQDDPDPGHPSS
ncbi:16S rRNA (guanine(966)-N(2))-methyltransferase RsmD [Nocardioides sp. 503]|uniref:16S rRNA (guanine(966)-N(2))-methyltransferase RsmD n=1 Tax=Nocardioides sp. 503 TaxID=2508326 RepID=UPI0010700952|nr:16S rRNA (guanine(966)-N(2))-methyltransferase RsmD [Nocardioides sp. 503]